MQNGYYNDPSALKSSANLSVGRRTGSQEVTPVGVSEPPIEGTACYAGFREVEEFVGPQK